jgi:branched-chain amino acid transport system permease protein
MANFFQHVVAGLANGSIYATLALALVLIHRATGILNFAQGEIGMFATYIAWSLINTAGLTYWLAFAITLVIAFLGGVAVHQIAIRPFAHRSDLTVVIVTIALLGIINGAAGWIWSPQEKFFQSPFPLRVIHVGGVAINLQDLGVIGVSFACVAVVFVLFRFTRLGLQMRAAAVAPETSRVLGIRVVLMLTIGWGLASSLSAVAGMMAAQALVLSPNFMLVVLTYAFAAAVLGGIDSPVGAVLGAYILGVGINLLTEYVGWLGSSLQLPVALAVLLIVILVKPAGLFGSVVVRRV